MCVSFVEQFNRLPIESLCQKAKQASESDVFATLAKNSLILTDLANLLSPNAANQLECLAKRSNKITQQKNAKEQSNWVELKALREKAQKLTENIKQSYDFKKIQKAVVANLYTELPPRRADYSEVTHTL